MRELVELVDWASEIPFSYVWSIWIQLTTKIYLMKSSNDTVVGLSKKNYKRRTKTTETAGSRWGT